MLRAATSIASCHQASPVFFAPSAADLSSSPAAVAIARAFLGSRIAAAAATSVAATTSATIGFDASLLAFLATLRTVLLPEPDFGDFEPLGLGFAAFVSFFAICYVPIICRLDRHMDVTHFCFNYTTISLWAQGRARVAPSTEDE
jgi:hypothetical protein